MAEAERVKIPWGMAALLFALLSASCTLKTARTSQPLMLVPYVVFAVLTVACAIIAWRLKRNRVLATSATALLIGWYVALWLAVGYETEEEIANVQAARESLVLLRSAMDRYYAEHRRFPPAAICDPKGNPLLSWRVALLPYLKEKADQELYNEFKLDEPWDSTHNEQLIARMPEVYNGTRRPNAPPDSTVWQVFVGPGTAFDATAALRLPPDDFPGGPRELFLIVEAADPVPWTKPEDLPYTPDGPLPSLGGVRRHAAPPVLFMPVLSRWMLALHAGGEIEHVDLDATDEETLRHFIAHGDGGE